ncbi:MAG: GAP family protein [Leucobacter sp.]
MIATIWQILPVTLGVIASPIAVLALLGIILSENARRNAVAYSAGWVLATTAVLAFWLWLLGVVQAVPDGESLLIRGLHLVVAICCLGGALLIYRRARVTLARVSAARTPDELVAATPQLPGLLRSTEHYTPTRSFLLGAAVFLFNPTNSSLVVATVLDLRASGLDADDRLTISIGFVVAAALPVVVPSLLLVVEGKAAEPTLHRLYDWVLHNNGFVSAALLMLVGFTQLGHAFKGVLT